MVTKPNENTAVLGKLMLVPVVFVVRARGPETIALGREALLKLSAIEIRDILNGTDKGE